MKTVITSIVGITITFATGPLVAYLAFQIDPSLALGAFMLSFPVGACVGATVGDLV